MFVGSLRRLVLLIESLWPRYLGTLDLVLLIQKKREGAKEDSMEVISNKIRGMHDG